MTDGVGVNRYFQCVDEDGRYKACEPFWQVEVQGTSPRCPTCKGMCCLPIEPPAEAAAVPAEEAAPPVAPVETEAVQALVGGLVPAKRRGRPPKSAATAPVS